MIRKLITTEIFPDAISKAIQFKEEGAVNLKSILMDYAKDPDIVETNRKFFYKGVETVEDRSFKELGVDISKVVLDIVNYDDKQTPVGENISGDSNGVHEENIPIPPLNDMMGGYDDMHVNQFDDEDDYVDPYENLTEEELIQKLPPYFNKTNKQKKKFFKNLNKTFSRNLNGVKIKNERKNKNKLDFQLGLNQVVKFKKDQKITGN